MKEMDRELTVVRVLREKPGNEKERPVRRTHWSRGGLHLWWWAHDY